MTSSLPFSLQKAIGKLSIEPGEVLYSFCSNAAPDGNLGESWFLFLDSTLSLIMVTPLLDDMQLQSRFFVKNVKEIEARRTFLGNLHLIFVGSDGQRLGEFVVPGLQQNLWESLLSLLEKRFPGKLKEDEELLKQRLSDQVDPETGLPSILSTAEAFGGDLRAMSDGRISVTGGPRQGSDDLTVHSAKDFQHYASAAQIVSGPSSLTSVRAVEVDTIDISQGMSVSGLDQSMLSSSHAVENPISLEVVDRSGSMNLPDLAGTSPSVISSSTEEYILPRIDQSAPQQPREDRASSGKKKKNKNAPPAQQAPQEQATEAEGTRCPSCGRANKADYFYCLGCGAQLLKLPKEAPSQPTPRKQAKSGAPKVAFGASTAQEPSGEGLISGCLSQLFLVLLMMAGVFLLLGLFS